MLLSNIFGRSSWVGKLSNGYILERECHWCVCVSSHMRARMRVPTYNTGKLVEQLGYLDPLLHVYQPSLGDDWLEVSIWAVLFLCTITYPIESRVLVIE